MVMKRISAGLITALMSLGFAQFVPTTANALEVSSAVQMPGTDHFYQFYSNATSWQSARGYAISLTYQGSIGHLANVTSAAENSFISSLGNRGWIGARRDSSQTFRWFDGPEAGQTLTFTSWSQGEPNNCCGGEPFIESAGSWNDNGGMGETFGYFVEFEPAPDPVQMPGTSNYYRFVSAEGISWATASSRASELTFQGQRGHLATIQSQEENAFILGLTKGTNSWLGGGLADSSINAFQWLVEPDAGKVFTTCSRGLSTCQNNSALYSNWETLNQPEATGEDRVVMVGGGLWHDWPNNSSLYGYVVEFEKTIWASVQPSLSGISVAGEKVQANPGTYSVGSSIDSVTWQISDDNQNWSDVPGSDSSIKSDATNYLVKKTDSGKSLRIKVLVSNGSLSKTFYSSSVSLKGTFRFIQPHSSLSWDRLCVIESLTHNLQCQGASIPNISMQAQNMDSSVNTLCAVSLTSKVKCWLWGTNYLQTGAPDSEGYVTGISGAVAVTNGYAATCALIIGGQVKCWGHTGWRILGPNIPYDSASPVTIQGIEDVVQIESGWDHVCALKSNGDVYCWGRNDRGQLGVGYTNRLVDVPTKVLGLSKVTSISAERYHGCATTSDGKVWCWGDNDWAEAGNGTYLNSIDTPVQVSDISNARRVYSGSDFNCAVTIDNKAYCWGANNLGQSSTGAATPNYPAPPRLLSLENVDSMLLGHGESCAVLKNGETRCWGANQFSDLKVPSANYTYETEVNTFAPKPPVVKSVSTASGTISLTFDKAEFTEGSILQARTLDGAATCNADGAGLCTLTGLTDLISYGVEVRVSADSGSSTWSKLAKSYVPHTPGLQLWFEENNLKVGDVTKVNILDAQPNSNIWVKIGSNPKFGIRTDETGAASTSAWLSKSTIAKVTVASGKKSAFKYLYSPVLNKRGPITRLGKLANFTVSYSMPGSQVQITVSDGRTLNFTTTEASKLSFAVPFTTKGLFTYVIKVNGKNIGTGEVYVY
jgi:alpha-tubulin suppressor-like RCC1 family protein